MSKKDKPVLTFYGVFTKTKYEIYPENANYKAIYGETPEKIAKETMSGQLEQLGAALKSLLYGIIYRLGFLK